MTTTSATRARGRRARTKPLIAHVVYRFDVGGLENGVVNLVNRMPVDHSDHAIVALTDVTDFRERIVRDGVTFHALHKPPGHGIDIYRKLYATIRALAPSIVHTRNIAASEAQLPAMLARVPVRIHGEHGWDLGDVGGGKQSHHLQRRLVRPLVHRFVALSTEIRRYLEERVGVPASRIAQICNGVDTERFRPADPRHGRPGPAGRHFRGQGLFVVGTVGRLSPVKHQRLLIEAFAMACRMAGEVAPEIASSLRLVVAGDGPDRAMLEHEIRASGLADRIWMAGRCDDVASLLSGLDLFVLPSLAEGISNTILEAMASGVPVLATRVGGNAELIAHGKSGTLVPSNDAEAMAHAIVDYALHPDRSDVHGTNAREIAVERFSIDAMVGAYQGLYDAELATRLHRHVPAGSTGTARMAQTQQS